MVDVFDGLFSHQINVLLPGLHFNVLTMGIFKRMWIQAFNRGDPLKQILGVRLPSP